MVFSIVLVVQMLKCFCQKHPKCNYCGPSLNFIPGGCHGRLSPTAMGGCHGRVSPTAGNIFILLRSIQLVTPAVVRLLCCVQFVTCQRPMGGGQVSTLSVNVVLLGGKIRTEHISSHRICANPASSLFLPLFPIPQYQSQS